MEGVGALSGEPLDARDVIVASLSGLISGLPSNPTVTFGNAADHLIAELARHGLAIVRKSEAPEA
jgi:hypothetical protein